MFLILSLWVLNTPNIINTLPGLYFLGFPWLNSRKSGIIYGIQEDAGIIAGAITKYLA